MNPICSFAEIWYNLDTYYRANWKPVRKQETAYNSPLLKLHYLVLSLHNKKLPLARLFFVFCFLIFILGYDIVTLVVYGCSYVQIYSSSNASSWISPVVSS